MHSMHDDQIFIDFNRKTFLCDYQNEALMTKHVLLPQLYKKNAGFF